MVNTLLLDQYRTELAKAAAGVSPGFRKNEYRTTYNVNYIVDTVIDPTRRTIVLTDGSQSISLLDSVEWNSGTGPLAIGTNTLHINDGTGVFYGQVIKSYIYNSPTNIIIVLNDPVPELTGNQIKFGMFKYNGILSGVVIGSFGFDESIETPRPVTGHEDKLFHGNPTYYQNLIPPQIFNPDAPPDSLGMFALKELKWLGDVNNLEDDEDLQPMSVYGMAEIGPTELLNEEINEFGVVMNFWSDEEASTGSYYTLMIGLSTFSTKIKDQSDIFEIHFKVNF
jgi:hypothetical protein